MNMHACEYICVYMNSCWVGRGVVTHFYTPLEEANIKWTTLWEA